MSSFSEKLRHLSNTDIKRTLIVGMKVRGKDVKAEKHKCCFLQRGIQSGFLNRQSTRPSDP